MKVYNLKRETILPVGINYAWDFFSNPLNLSKLTPPDMKFQVLTNNLPVKIFTGLMISYHVTPIPGFKLNWLTEIKQVQEPYYFIDEQRKGPYSLWLHQHSFSEKGKDTLMKDEVYYALPVPLLGSLLHKFYIKNKLINIFNYREKMITEIFKQN